MDGAEEDALVIGVLALQGSFREHMHVLNQLGQCTSCEVRTPQDLQNIHGLIIPGGESTAMALLANAVGLLEALKKFCEKKPVWGTCAGLIFLAERALGTKSGGQGLIGGLHVTVNRNYFGSQISSFSQLLAVKDIDRSDVPFEAIFIRAPAITEMGPNVKVLCSIVAPHKETSPSITVAVAVRENHILATAFHPELTGDFRLHSYFLRMVVDAKNILP